MVGKKELDDVAAAIFAQQESDSLAFDQKLPPAYRRIMKALRDDMLENRNPDRSEWHHVAMLRDPVTQLVRFGAAHPLLIEPVRILYMDSCDMEQFIAGVMIEKAVIRRAQLQALIGAGPAEQQAMIEKPQS
jgi:hypothetical protein